MLAAIVAALGPALTSLPLSELRLVVGGLLLVFGLQWLRKAILRASGHKALHDEDADLPRASWPRPAAPPAERSPGSSATGTRSPCRSKAWSSKASRWCSSRSPSAATSTTCPLAAVAAVAAVVGRDGAGVAVRAPLARVPENTMKFVVGVMLTRFGTFWGAEGAGAHWPGSDAALLVLIPAVASVLPSASSRCSDGAAAVPSAGPGCGAGLHEHELRAFAAFWYDFVIGDDWRVAAGVTVALGTTAAVSVATPHVWWIVPLAVAFLLPASLRRAIRP